MRFGYVYKIVLGYTASAVIYIALSDWLLFRLWPDSPLVAQISIFKGFGFVGITALTLAWLLARINILELRRYTALLQTHHAVILVIDPVTGRILDASRAAARFYGWSLHQLRTMQIADINLLSATEVQQEMDLALQQNRHVFHFRHRLADGGVRDVDVHTGPIELDGRTLLLSIVHDVTEQHQAQVELERLNRLYALLSHTNLLILRASGNQQLLDGICRIMCEQGGFVFCWISGQVPGDGVKVLAKAGDDGGYLDSVLKLQHEISCATSGEGPDLAQVFVSNDYQADARTELFHDAARKAGIHSAVALPIHNHGRLLGSLGIYSTEPGFFGTRELATLEEMAQDISFGLDNVERIQLLEVASAVIDTSPVILFRWRAAAGWPVEFVSPNVTRWGYSAAALVSGNMTYDKFIHPQDLERVAAAIAVHLADTTNEFRQAYRILTSLGEVRWVEDQTTVVRNADGTPLYLQGVVTDITDKHKIELALCDSDERFRKIVEHAPDLIFINRDDCIHYINPAGVRLLQAASAEQLVGRSIYALFQPEIHPHIQAGIAQLRSRPGSVVSVTSVSMLALDGTLVEMDLTAVSYQTDGKIDIQTTCRDMREQRTAERTSKDYLQKLEASVLGTASAVAQLVELRDPYTAGHERRVGELAAAIAVELGLDENTQRGLRVAGSVHDVGKIMVPAEILAKPGRLTDIERSLVQQHAEQGYQVLKNVAFPWPVAQIARQHHERLDGSGYPQGLKGDEIIFEARITAVADVLESMSSHRPYRESLGIDQALHAIEQGSGTLYDPLVASAALRLFRERGYTMPQ